MSILFDTTKMNNMILKNRFVRSATWEGMATGDGFCTPELTRLMEALAEGRVGMIITGHAYVQRDGQAGPGQLGIYCDEQVEGLRQMTGAVHHAGGKIVLQLAHAGCQAVTQLTGHPAKGPSSPAGEPDGDVREMTRDQIRQMVESFGDGARRALEAGFDGVQIHAAHGYLLNQFLSPYFNKRTDEYGGSPENRYRLIVQIYRRVRAIAGKDYPVLIKLNSEDFLPDGFSLDEMIRLSGVLEKEGIDAIEMSGGTRYSGKYIFSRPGKIAPEDEAYYRKAAIRYKQQIHVPLILVGGIRSFPVAEALVNDGVADYISLCRPLICEPDLIRRWESGDLRSAVCISDNLCYGPAREGKGIFCVTRERLAAGSKK